MLYYSSIGRVLLSLYKVVVAIVDTGTHNMTGSEPAGQSKTETWSKVTKYRKRVIISEKIDNPSARASKSLAINLIKTC